MNELLREELAGGVHALSIQVVLIVLRNCTLSHREPTPDNRKNALKNEPKQSKARRDRIHLRPVLHAKGAKSTRRVPFAGLDTNVFDLDKLLTVLAHVFRIFFHYQVWASPRAPSYSNTSQRQSPRFHDVDE